MCLATNEIVVACTMVQIVVFPREHHHLQVTKESYRSIISSVFLLPCLCGLAIYDLYHKHTCTLTGYDSDSHLGWISVEEFLGLCF